MEQVVSVNVMRESDKITMQQMEDPRMLMYRAGKAVYESYHWHGAVAIFAVRETMPAMDMCLRNFFAMKIFRFIYICAKNGSHHMARIILHNVPHGTYLIRCGKARYRLHMKRW